MSSKITFIGESPNVQSLLRATKLVAATNATVLIQGESGTGKELLAQTIHQHSVRFNKPLITINCAALPEHLAESELFGHRKGAFTGAHHEHAGRIRAAAEGTVFLDEIGELPLSMQAKLLRFLESGECHAVGETKPYHVNVRLIAATNRNLYDMVEKGEFREDLYYRLHIVPLQIPALRSRGGDISRLLQHFTAEFAQRHQLDAPTYDKKAVELLNSHAWSGNVRELRNFCERMVILCSNRIIQPENLPIDIRQNSDSQTNSPIPSKNKWNLQEMEISMIRQALQSTDGNRSKAARMLGISRDTLLYRIKKYAI